MGQFRRPFTVRDVQDTIVPRGVKSGLALDRIAAALGLDRRGLDMILTAIDGRDMTLRDYLAALDLHRTPPYD